MNFSDSTDHLLASGSVRTTLRSSASFLSILGLGVGAALLFGTSAADAAYYYNYGYGGYYSGYRAAPTPSYRQTRPVARKAKKPQEEQAKKEAPKPIKGPLSIIVSVGEQRARVFDGTSQIAESPVSSGMRGYPTPMGVFTVIQKDRYHHSNLYAGAPMPYMQRITWSGTAMHTGVLPGYAASHGCIRLPNSFAARLWTMTKLGTRVIVARHGLQPAPIAHAKLDALKKSPAETVPIVEGTGGKTAANAPSERSVTDGFSTPMPGLPSDQFKPSTEILKDAKPVPAAVPVLALGSEPAPTAAPAKPALKPGPVAIFISKKEGKLFVRKGFDPVFDIQVKIDRPEVPLGTHVFTATDLKDDGVTMNWIAVSLPPEARAAEPRAESKHGKGKNAAKPAPTPVVASTSATDALDRIELPAEALDRLAEMLSPGAALIISDKGLGHQTGKGTEFIVLQR